MEEFLKGTFTSGGIFDEPAKVTFKKSQQQAPPNLEELIRRQAAPKKPEVSKATKNLDRIKKLEALANDPGAAPAERESARRMANKLRGY